MALTLYLHPLSSFCHKVLFALYENNVEFKAQVLNLQDKNASAAFYKMWPIGKIPLLHDDKRGQTLPETTIMLEYLDQNYPGPLKLFPADAKMCLEARLWDRILDSYIHLQMQKIVGDRLRPAESRDPHGVEEAKTIIRKTYDLLEGHLKNHLWILGDPMSIADCAALPALFYGGIVVPYSAATHPNIAAYFERLYVRPSVQRVFAEAKPYFKYFPYVDQMPARFLNQ